MIIFNILCNSWQLIWDLNSNLFDRRQAAWTLLRNLSCNWKVTAKFKLLTETWIYNPKFHFFFHGSRSEYDFELLALSGGSELHVHCRDIEFFGIEIWAVSIIHILTFDRIKVSQIKTIFFGLIKSRHPSPPHLRIYTSTHTHHHQSPWASILSHWVARFGFGFSLKQHWMWPEGRLFVNWSR